MTDTKTELLLSSFTEGRLQGIKIEHISSFDISKVFDCGQSFRFDRVEKSLHQAEFSGCVFNKYISIAQDNDTVYIYNVSIDEADKTIKFLGLDKDYEKIDRTILSSSRNPALKDALKCSNGIRILHQDGWEAICSFIISQNNNIPRIKGIVADLCQACGELTDISLMECHISEAHYLRKGNFYTFPTPEKILPLGIDGLFKLKTGFRAKYIYDAVEKALSGELDLDLIASIGDKDKAVEHLCKVKGIGPKVANCALLFGFGYLDCFPIDVWIKKVIAKYFSEDFDPATLGEYAGIAQQYLFYYERYLNS